MNAISPTTAVSVANEFLALGASDITAPAIDQMKLQKLLFYSHAWHLATLNGPLFEEDFEAWPWGPVVRNIYNQTTRFGRGPVTMPLSELADINGTFRFVQPAGVSSALKPFIRQVWDTHRKFTGVQLSNSTHAPGEPWTIIKETYGSLDSKPTIPNDLIAAIFKKKLADARRSGSAESIHSSAA